MHFRNGGREGRERGAEPGKRKLEQWGREQNWKSDFKNNSSREAAMEGFRYWAEEEGLG